MRDRIRSIIGTILISIGLTPIFIMMIDDIGWKGAIIVVGAALGMAFCIISGLYLLSSHSNRSQS